MDHYGSVTLRCTNGTKWTLIVCNSESVQKVMDPPLTECSNGTKWTLKGLYSESMEPNGRLQVCNSV